jgi:HAE1 family hydrophobic/amphiphilic exporter-1
VFSRYFIDRPRFAIVISLFLIIGGALALVGMPIAQFPPITPPVVQVTASYPGANAETVESTVTIPIEQEVNGVDGMLYMSSQSSNSGNMTLSVTFDVDTNPDIAQVNVQNRVALAEARLPEETKRQGITVRKQSTAVLLFIQLRSPNGTFDNTFLSNYARINLVDRLLRLPGVGDTQIYAGAYYSMRVWLDPARMASLGISTSDIAAAIREQNVQVATGQLGQMPVGEDQQLRFTLETKGRLTNVKEFEDIIVRANADGSLIRLADVGRVELGAETYDRFAYLGTSPSVPLAVFLQPGANALETARAVADTMAEAATRFPKDMTYEIPYDTTKFVKESIIEVLKTLGIAATLVIVVVFVFLQDWRATLIPMATIPVSLIGALLVLNILGYSINTITLFGLILAIGIVVDDAIVVIENAQRLIGKGMAARPAAIETMRQVTGPVIATTLVLLAVFIPVGFLPGITGQLYQQFAVTLAAAVSISSLNALTLSPALCATLLGGPARRPWLPLRLFERGFAGISARYGGIVAVLVRRVAIVVVAFAALMAATYFGYTQLPASFLPDEDQGYFFVDVQLPDGAALPRTQQVMEKIYEIMEETPGIDKIIRINGLSLISGASTNAGLGVGVLQPWADRQSRGLDVQQIIGRLQPQFAAIQEAKVFAFNPPAIRGLGRTGGFEFQLQDIAGRSPQDLAAAMRALVFAANQQPEVTRVFSTFQAEAPRIAITVDRVKAKTLGVPLSEIFATLQTQLGSLYVNDFNKFGRVFQVRLQAESFARDDPEDILRLYVRNDRGETIPLETLISLAPTIGPETITRYNLFRSAQINGSAAPGFSSGDAITAMERTAATTLPPGTSFEWSGLSLQEIKAGNVAPIIFALAFVFVYLSLVALYESWTVPLAVILSVPAALSGAVGAQLLLGLQNNIYAQIGFVLLIGLASKNAILIVEFAIQEHRRGRDVRSAALRAARLRFRAVIMTAFSFVLGTIPLVIATGAGGASRQSLGSPVFGGMITAAVLGTIVVPVFFVGVARLFPSQRRQQTEVDANSSAAVEPE